MLLTCDYLLHCLYDLTRPLTSPADVFRPRYMLRPTTRPYLPRLIPPILGTQSLYLPVPGAPTGPPYAPGMSLTLGLLYLWGRICLSILLETHLPSTVRPLYLEEGSISILSSTEFLLSISLFTTSTVYLRTPKNLSISLVSWRRLFSFDLSFTLPTHETLLCRLGGVQVHGGRCRSEVRSNLNSTLLISPPYHDLTSLCRSRAMRRRGGPREPAAPRSQGRRTRGGTPSEGDPSALPETSSDPSPPQQAGDGTPRSTGSRASDAHQAQPRVPTSTPLGSDAGSESEPPEMPPALFPLASSDDPGISRVVRGIVEEMMELQLARLSELVQSAVTSRDSAHLEHEPPPRPVAVRPRGPSTLRLSSAGAPDDDGDPPGDDSDSPGSHSLPDAPPSFRPPPRRNSVERMVENFGESDLSQIWSRENRLAVPRSASNLKWPDRDGKMILRKPPKGRPVTARLYLDFYKEHLIMLSQVNYPLTYYVEDEMKSYIETFFKEENLRFLPEDIQAEGIVSFAHLSNRALIYVAQLSIRPTSRDKWLEALWSCPRPGKPDSSDSFIDQNLHYNYNMGLLNALHETIDYLNLNGGVKHMPPLDWRQDKDRVGPSGKKQALGLARVISEMLSGALAPRIVIHFRPRTIEEENESTLTSPPNYGKPREPTTVAGLLASFRSIYRYYFTIAEGVKRIREDYEGPLSTLSISTPEVFDRAQRRPAKHPVLRVIEAANEEGNEQLLNLLHAFATDATVVLQNVTDDELDTAVDGIYTEHLQVLQTTPSTGVCYSAMLSPTGHCNKPHCPHRHEKESFKFGVLEQIAKYMGTQGYKDAITAGLIEPIKLKPDWDKAVPPPTARATLPQRMGQSKFQQNPTTQVPFITPQAARYKQRPPEQKLHVTHYLPPDSEDDSSTDENPDPNLPPLPHLSRMDDSELDYRRRAAAVLRRNSPLPTVLSYHLPETNTLDSAQASANLESSPDLEYSELLEDGTRLYHLSTSVVTGMPTLSVQLSCGVSLESLSVEVEAPLDTGATQCYMSQSLCDELEPNLDPRAIKPIRSRVRMGAPPDHHSDRQVDLKVQWEHNGSTYAAILRFVVLRTENLRVIIGLNAILLAGLLDPLVTALREMREQALPAPTVLYLQESKSDDDADSIPTHHLRVIPRYSLDNQTSQDAQRPFIGAGRPPSQPPLQSQLLEPPTMPVRLDPQGDRHLQHCPLYALHPDLLASWPEARLDHDNAIQLFMRGDHLSFTPRFRPFYWMDLTYALHQEPESPLTCLPNYNGRYTVWYGVAIWQWGVYMGTADSIRFSPHNSYEDVSRFLHPERYNVSFWPFSLGRIRPDYPGIPAIFQASTVAVMLQPPQPSPPPVPYVPRHMEVPLPPAPISNDCHGSTQTIEMIVPPPEAPEPLSSVSDRPLQSNSSPSTPEASPPLDQPPAVARSSKRKRRRLRNRHLPSQLFSPSLQASPDVQSVEILEDIVTTNAPVPSIISPQSTLPRSQLSEFGELLMALNAFVGKWSNSLLLPPHRSPHFHRKVPQKLHKFLQSRDAVEIIQDYFDHQEDLSHWRTQLFQDYFAGDVNQPIYPALKLLRVFYQQPESKPICHSQIVSKPGTTGSDQCSTAPYCSYPGCRIQLPIHDLVIETSFCSDHAQPVDLLASPVSTTRSPPHPMDNAPPTPPHSSSVTSSDVSEISTPKKKRRRRKPKSSSGHEPSRNLPRPPDDPDDTFGSAKRYSNPVILLTPPVVPTDMSGREKTPTSHSACDQSQSLKASEVTPIFQSLTLQEDRPDIPVEYHGDSPHLLIKEEVASLLGVDTSSLPISRTGITRSLVIDFDKMIAAAEDDHEIEMKWRKKFNEENSRYKELVDSQLTSPETSSAQLRASTIPIVLEPAKVKGSSTVKNDGDSPVSFLTLMMLQDLDFPHDPNEDANLIEPWTTDPLEQPPEEAETIEVGIFKGLEDRLGASDEKLYEHFLSILSEHVDPDFAKAQPIIELLRSDLARRIFVPFMGEWTGINGIPPLELQFLPSMPERMAARARPLNPLIVDKAWPLFSKMCNYFFEPSRSPCASPIVLAAKATFPYVRICGDYRKINQYIVVPQDIIPFVRKELEKTRDFSIFADIDCMNAFHQLSLAPYTRERLAVATPWGLFQPKFLPEGVGPASGALQKVMESVFEDFKDWMIIVFDNLLILAKDFGDLYQKVEKVFQRCDERHVLLKMEKSWLGVRTAHFFGYEVSSGSYKLSQKRREAIASIPMPKDQKSMQRFLGAALYFKTHVPFYSELTADLNEMVRKEFNWDPSSWTKDYCSAMEKLKDAIMQSATLHFPDYSLPWVVRCDASEKACGGTLLQERNDKSFSQPTFEVIAFVSKKFSGAAERWDIPKKEAYAIYYSVKELAYYLEVKHFVIETDHANLVWIEKSEAAIVIRWRLYLQGFAFKIRHIPGKANVFADMLSRMYSLASEDPDSKDGGPSQFLILQSLPDDNPPGPLEYNTLFLGATDYHTVEETIQDFLQQAHVVNRKHCGVRDTRANLNRFFPGHRIHFDVVNEFCASCTVCQKNRRGMLPKDILEPVVKNLKPPHRRSRVGIDTFHCSPPDKEQHVCIHVVVNHFTNFVALYPSIDHTAVGMARALFRFFTTYGLYDEIASDPGSNLTADITEELIRLFGTNHRFGLVGVHTSSGVEGTNNLVLTHLRSVCADKSFRERWGSPEVSGLVQFMINDSVCGETGLRRFDNMFGSEAGIYFKLPEFLAESARSHEYLRLLNEDLQRLSELSRLAHSKVVRSRRTPITDETRNVYLRGFMTR